MRGHRHIYLSFDLDSNLLIGSGRRSHSSLRTNILQFKSDCRPDHTAEQVISYVTIGIESAHLIYLPGVMRSIGVTDMWSWITQGTSLASVRDVGSLALAWSFHGGAACLLLLFGKIIRSMSKWWEVSDRRCICGHGWDRWRCWKSGLWVRVVWDEARKEFTNIPKTSPSCSLCNMCP